jgi:hypothetical protein
MWNFWSSAPLGHTSGRPRAAAAASIADFRTLLGGHDAAALCAGLHAQQHQGGRPFVTPQRLPVLRQPLLDGRTIEGHPHLGVGRCPILLHIATRITHQGAQGGVLIGIATARDANQHGLHRILEGGTVRRVRAVGKRCGRLIHLGARHRAGCRAEAKADDTHPRDRNAP